MIDLPQIPSWVEEKNASNENYTSRDSWITQVSQDAITHSCVPRKFTLEINWKDFLPGQVTLSQSTQNPDVVQLISISVSRWN